MENNDLKITIGVIVGSLVLIGGIIGLLQLTQKPSKFDIGTTIGESKNFHGPDNAGVTVVEFSDFQCPACEAAYPEVSKFLEAYPNEVRFVYRHFPLPQHGNARPAAYAAEAAALQGKFWEAYEYLFENQSSWESAAEVDADFFYQKLSEKITLDKDKFVNDYKSNTVRDLVANDVSAGNNLGVNSTPTFFINGTKYSGVLSFNDLIKAAGLSEKTETPTPTTQP